MCVGGLLHRKEKNRTQFKLRGEKAAGLRVIQKC